jgi:tripartite-type tricarboxylate transporter receptor subunit TctC
MVVLFPPGGPADTAARIMAERMRANRFKDFWR